MDLKNKLTEEEVRELLNIMELEDSHYLTILKQAGIIRKSAEEETDEYIDNIDHVIFKVKDMPCNYSGGGNKQLIQLVAAERAERIK